MLEFLLAYPKLVFQPRRAFQQIAEESRSLEALVILLLAMVVSGLKTGVRQDESIRKLATIAPIVGTLYGQILLTCALSLLFAVIKTFLLHIVSELFGGKGNLRSLWTSVLAMMTLSAIVGLIPIPHIAWLVGLWNYVLMVMALMAVYGFRWAKAAGIAIIQFILMLVGAGIFGIALARLAAGH